MSLAAMTWRQWLSALRFRMGPFVAYRAWFMVSLYAGLPVLLLDRLFPSVHWFTVSYAHAIQWLYPILAVTIAWEWFPRLFKGNVPHVNSAAAGPPAVCVALICVLLPASKQQVAIGDFAELYSTVWCPCFGPRWANVVYCVQVLRTANAMIRYAAVAAIMDRVSAFFRST
jgi:hypothetical protein